MHLFFLHAGMKIPKDQPDKHELLPMHEPQHNTTEGSEFMDDALRMDDEPIVYTEESIAPGSPENLL